MKTSEISETDQKSKDTGNGFFLRLLAAGVVFAMVLFAIAALYALHLFDRKMQMDEASKGSSNPLIGSSVKSDKVDDAPEEIGGVRVYNAEKDAPLIYADVKVAEKQFEKSLASGKISNAELMQKRNQFAAERLALLKKLESVTSPAERKKLIDEFNTKHAPAEK